MQNTHLWPEKHLWWSIWEIYLGKNSILTIKPNTRGDQQKPWKGAKNVLLQTNACVLVLQSEKNKKNKKVMQQLSSFLHSF